MLPWSPLLKSFVLREIDARTFHDRFFEEWHRISAGGFAEHVPTTIERLFFVVEAYCPDVELRDPASPYEADETELRQAAVVALAEIEGD
jgi:hypothetical protein